MKVNKTVHPRVLQSSLLCLGATADLLTGGIQTAHAAIVPFPESPIAETADRPVIAESTAAIAQAQATQAGITPTEMPEAEWSSHSHSHTVQPTQPGDRLQEIHVSDAVAIPTIASTPLEILAPVAQTSLDQPSTMVMVQFPTGSQVELQVNGRTVASTLKTRTETDEKLQRTVQTWYGVPLNDGDNTLSAVITRNGQSHETSVQVRVKGASASLQLESDRTRVPADGRSTVTVQGKLVDETGAVIKRDAIVTLTTTAGEFISPDEDQDLPGFQVKAHRGTFSVQLRTGLDAKTVTINAISDTLRAETAVIFETDLRPSIATGYVDLRIGRKGLNFHGNLRDFLPIDGTNGTSVDLNSAAFATGRLGEWLFTGAFNSDRPLNKTCEGEVRLFRELQSCETTYPVYGDSSQSAFLTPSTDHVFLKLDRTSPVAWAGNDYAMWGDYWTEEFASKSQEFTATTRPLHGFKANYNFGDLQVTGLYANNLEGFQRDTLAPDGTSGYYFLSQRSLTPGSESIFLETEEMDRPGTVLERKALSRGLDYDIDYDRGTILFKEPVLRTGVDAIGTPLVRRIVATYQHDTLGTEGTLWGGRLRYHFSRQPQQERWIGGTYLKQEQGIRSFELAGADTYLSLGKSSYFLAEYAHSENESESLDSVSGSAYRAELVAKPTDALEGRAYYRSADSGFANNATVSFVPGQTRYGAQVSANLTDSTRLRAQYDHESNDGVAPQPQTVLGDLLTPRQTAIPGTRVDNDLTTISAGITQTMGASQFSLDWLHRDREDQITPNNSVESHQLRSRLSVPLAKNLDFIAQNEATLSSKADPFYQDRTLLGLNYALLPGVNLQLAQQFFHKGEYAGQSLTNLSINSQYRLGPDTLLTGRYALLGGANSLTNVGAIGINQKLKITPGLRATLAYEHVFGSRDRNSAAPMFIQPFAPGQSASSLALTSGDSYSVGLEYDDNAWFNASARYEHRSSSVGSNTVISAGATGKISPALTALVRYQQANSANQLLPNLGETAKLKVGLAYRDPNSDAFNALLRYEYRKNPAITLDRLISDTNNDSNEHLLAMEAIYAPSAKWELYGKFGMRDSHSFLADDLKVRSQILLGQTRLTFRPAKSWDIVGEARWIGQPTDGYSETGFAVETGYYLTPSLRLAAGYSFGKAHDRDLSDRSASGSYVGITLKVNELFNGFGLQKVTPQQQEESLINPTEIPTIPKTNL